MFGDRKQIIPRTSEQDAGDLSPVGVGSRGAELVLDRLQVLRDIYYIAVSAEDHSPHFVDYDPVGQATQTPEGVPLPPLRNDRQLFVDAATWPRFLTRKTKEFVVKKDQFFVMGDNSPASLDCRLWKGQREQHKGIPGGAYLDRQLLTGKAICVFWPHSWGSIPGLNKLPGFPNFGDMRIVR